MCRNVQKSLTVIEGIPLQTTGSEGETSRESREKGPNRRPTTQEWPAITETEHPITDNEDHWK